MKIKYLSSTIILLLLIVLIPAGVYGQDGDMKKVATERLNEWQKTFTDDQAMQLGFASLDDFKKAELGEPFKVYTIAPEAINGFEEGSEFGQIVTETNYYVYPVMTDGSNKALLWMMRKDGVWHVARIGSSDLAKTMRMVEGKMEGQKAARGLEGAPPPKFVRVYQLYLDFLYVKGQHEYIIPMYNIPSLKLEGSNFYSPSEFIPQMKEQLKLKMPEERGSGEQHIEG